MTGAGSGDLLFGHEDTFKGTVTDPDSSGNPSYWEFGRDPVVNELDLERTLERLRAPDSVISVESVTQRLEGALNIEAVCSNDVHGEVEQLVFNDGGTGFTTGRANSARVFTSLDYLNGTETRALEGTIPVEYSVEYQEGGMVRFSLTLVYADEERDVATPTDITRVSDGTSGPFHDFDLSLDTASVSKLQSATFTIADIARLQRGTQPDAVDAVLANPTPTLDFEAIVSSEDYGDDIYGGTTTTTPDDTITDFAATITVGYDGGTITTYELPSVKPESRSVNDLIATEDTTESVSLQVNDAVNVT